METHISLSSLSSSSLSSLHVSSILPLELEIHILTIFYHYLVCSFIIKSLSNFPTRVGDVYFIYILSLSNVSPILLLGLEVRILFHILVFFSLHLQTDWAPNKE